MQNTKEILSLQQIKYRQRLRSAFSHSRLPYCTKHTLVQNVLQRKNNFLFFNANYLVVPNNFVLSLSLSLSLIN